VEAGLFGVMAGTVPVDKDETNPLQVAPGRPKDDFDLILSHRIRHGVVWQMQQRVFEQYLFDSFAAP
jgi:hypothetical protein